MDFLIFLFFSFFEPTPVATPQPARVSPAQLMRAEFRRQTAAMLPVGEALANEIADALQDSSQEFNVDPKLMLALIYVESTGNPRAISKVGAIGLTQIMPVTGKAIAGELGVPWTGPEMLYDVRLNIRFGTFYMSQLMERFDGKHIPAVASYNWGPTSISRRLRQGKTIPTGYASKVLRNRDRVSL